MKMKLTAFSLALLLASVSFTSYADTLFRPRASFGFASYELAISQGSGGGSLADSTYLTGGFGATIAAENNVYFDFSYTTSLGATYDNGGIDDDFERTDISLTLGMVLEEGFTVFGGYKIGKTEYSDTLPTATASLLTFEATGIYFGLGMSLPVTDGSFSYNFAIAILEGELTDNDTFFAPFDATADTIGFSFGLGYTHFLTNDSGIIVKGAFQFYSFIDWVDPNFFIEDTDEIIFAGDISYFANF